MTSATKEQRRLLYEQLIGQRLADKFTVTGLLGFGGMGAVYEAIQSPMERKVALKVIPSYDPTAAARFEREAHTVSKLSHPNTVTVFDFGHTQDGQLFLSMEHLDGRTLTDLIRKEGPLHPARAIHITSQICRSLGEAHRMGIMHRDVKPDNILLITVDNDPDYVKVLDFGIAKAIQGEDDVNLTAEGRIVGTPRYMSPEQILALHVDHRSDLYSLGCIMFEMLCGSPPFEQQSTAALMMSHAQQMPPHFSERLQSDHLHMMPQGLEHIVHRTMAKSAEARPRDTDALREELEDALHQLNQPGGVPMRTPHLTGPRKRPPHRTSPTGNHTRHDHPSAHGGPPTGSFEHHTGDFSHQTGNFAHHHGASTPAAEDHDAFSRDMQHAQGQKRTPLIVGIVLLAIILLLGIGYVLNQPDPGTPDPGTTPAALTPPSDQSKERAPDDEAPAQGRAALSETIKLMSSPPGASVFDDQNKKIGITPYTVTRADLDGNNNKVYRLELDGHVDKAVTIDAMATSTSELVTLQEQERTKKTTKRTTDARKKVKKATKKQVVAQDPPPKEDPVVNTDPIKNVTPKVKKLGDADDDGPKVKKLD